MSEWGTPDSKVVARFAPSLAGDTDFCEWHQRYERHAATPESLRELLELSRDMEVREILPNLDVPTLVVHRTGDQVVPIEFGRELADKIPGARIFEQPGLDHFAYAGDMDGWMDEVERFVTGTVTPRAVKSPRSGAVRIVTLGGFGVEIDGEPVPISEWGSRRSRQLCKRLVTARAWPVTRDEIIDILWPDEMDMRRLGARLSVQLSGVRRVLGGGVIADRDAIRLDLDAVATDLETFFSAETDEEIVDAYTGEFLPEDRYEDWTAGIRDEARARFVTSARRIAERAFDSDPATSVKLAHRLISVDPYDSDAHRLLVRAHLSAGEAREASRAHESWTVALEELGIDVPPFESVRES